MKRLLATLLGISLITASVFGCSADNKQVPGDSAAVTTTAEPTTTTTEARGHFEFKPVVMSSIFRDIMGEDMCWAYGNYVNAVRAKEDSFEVKSEHDYDWMIGQFPAQFYPIYGVYTESD